MGCELISFHLIVRNDGKSINHEGLRQLQTSHVKAHQVTIHTIPGTIAWTSTISRVLCAILNNRTYLYVCMVSVQVCVLVFINHMTEYTRACKRKGPLALVIKMFRIYQNSQLMLFKLSIFVLFDQIAYIVIKNKF